jgi:hypothetical protein
MNELLTKMPELPKNLELAKNQVKKDIRNRENYSRWYHLQLFKAKNLGLTDDIRKKVYETVDKITMADVKKFHQNYFSGKPYTYCYCSFRKKSFYGRYEKTRRSKKISLEEIFGY